MKIINKFFNNLYKIFFPNLLKIVIDTDLLNRYYSINNNYDKFKIEENLNSKINEIFLYYNIHSNECINIYCQSFETIKTLYLETKYNLKNLDKIFPIFNNKCNINIVSLNYLHIEIQREKINAKILENIYNNIDKMPNIKYHKTIL